MRLCRYIWGISEMQGVRGCSGIFGGGRLRKSEGMVEIFGGGGGWLRKNRSRGILSREIQEDVYVALELNIRPTIRVVSHL